MEKALGGRLQNQPPFLIICLRELFCQEMVLCVLSMHSLLTYCVLGYMVRSANDASNMLSFKYSEGTIRMLIKLENGGRGSERQE